jgi:hypothetical protein
MMENQIPTKRNFAYRIISKALNLIPTDMSVENLSSRMIMVKATIDILKIGFLIKNWKLP